MTMQRYCIVSDDDGHEYVIPAENLDLWHSWLASLAVGPDTPDEVYDALDWDPPEWARRLEGRLTFTDPEF